MSQTSGFRPSPPAALGSSRGKNGAQGAGHRAQGTAAQGTGQKRSMRFVSTRGQAPPGPVSVRRSSTGWRRTAGSTCRPPSNGCRRSRCAGSRSSRSEMLIASGLVGRRHPRPALSTHPRGRTELPGAAGRAWRRRCTSLELFHGPTFAFKDVGARVMARLMAHFNEDDGAADRARGHVGRHRQRRGAGVLRRAAARAWSCSFPRARVTPVQEAQFTTLGGNVHGGRGRRHLRRLSAAGEGGLCRSQLVGAHASAHVGQLDQPRPPPSADVLLRLRRWCRSPGRASVFSVPSGNFGNLTAGMMAWTLGAPIHRLRRGDDDQRHGRRGICATGPLRASAVGADAGQCHGRGQSEQRRTHALDVRRRCRGACAATITAVGSHRRDVRRGDS